MTPRPLPNIRSTFYTHFDNKEDLLLSGLDGLRATLRDLQRKAHAAGTTPATTLFGYAEELFTHAAAHRDVFRAMSGKRSGAAVQQAFQKMLVDLAREDVTSSSWPTRPRSQPLDPTVQYVAGGLYATLMWWLEARPRPTVSEVTAAVRHLSLPPVLPSPP